VGAQTIRNGDLKIRPAFTRPGYEGQVKPMFEAGLEEFLKAQWVIGRLDDTAQELRDDEVVAIQSEYFRQYVVEWKTFIDAIETSTPEDYIGAMNMLNELTRGEPYKDLFSHISYHTQLVDLNEDGSVADDSTGRFANEAAKIGGRRLRQKLRVGRVVNPRLTRIAAAGVAKKIMEGGDAAGALVLTDLDVTYTFLGLSDFGARKAKPAPASEGAPPPPPENKPVDDYQDQLAILRTALQRRMDDPTEKDALAKDAKTAQSAVKSLLQKAEKTGWAPTLERILWPPVDLVWKLTEKGVAGDVASKWCADVVSTFETRLGKHYPFRRSGSDVPLADFEAFFHPE
jgi:type VI protein secretion system component VasK